MWLRSLGLGLIVSSSVQAHTFHDHNEGQRVESPSVTSGSAELLIMESLPQGDDIGSGQHYRKVEELLDKVEGLFREKDWFAYAQGMTLQFNHRFKEAIGRLESIDRSSPYYIKSRLLLSRLYTITGDSKSAEAVCRLLPAIAGIEVMMACLSDARSNSDPGIVMQLIGVNQSIEDEAMETWFSQLIAEHFEQKGEVTVASQYLDKVKEKYPSITSQSFWSQWSDMKLESKDYQSVFDVLSGIEKQFGGIDSGLLLRKLESMKGMGNLGQEFETLKKQLLKGLSPINNQADHPYELSRYYSNIEGDFKKAQKWAEENLKDNKTWKDAAWMKEIERELKEKSAE